MKTSEIIAAMTTTRLGVAYYDSITAYKMYNTGTDHYLLERAKCIGLIKGFFRLPEFDYEFYFGGTGIKFNSESCGFCFRFGCDYCPLSNNCIDIKTPLKALKNIIKNGRQRHG